MGAMPNFDLDTLLNRMGMLEDASGNPFARGRKGEIGLFQIMPQTARQYGVMPEQLTDPATNRRVAKSYLRDLFKRFKGDARLALEAYNAGPTHVAKGDVPAASEAYANKVLGGGDMPSLIRSQAMPDVSQAAQPSNVLTLPKVLSGLMGEGTAYAAEPVGYVKDKDGKFVPYHGPIAKTTVPAAVPTSSEKPEPLGARLAGWLPAVGQFGGEALGAIGGAAIPGAGETGVPEYVGATTGGALGSAAGAEAENKIRAAYGLPPVSVGEEAAVGGVGSAVGGLLPLVPRFRKAAAIMRATGQSFRDALEEARTAEAALEGTFGTSPRVAKQLEQAPASVLRKPYEETSERGLRDLGTEYDKLLAPYAHVRTANDLAQKFAARGPMLKLVGKPMRKYLQEQIESAPMTVRREQFILSQMRKLARNLDPKKDRIALSVLGELQKSAEDDIDRVIGPTAATQRRALDTYYARQVARFPLRGVRQAFTVPGAAEAILKAGKGDTGRVAEVIDQMKVNGQLGMLRRGFAARLYQKAETEGANNMADRLSALKKTVGGVDTEVFNKLYGAGAKKQWLRTADEVLAKHKELLAHPDEAAAVAARVREYLESPVLAPLAHYLRWGAALIAGGEAFGFQEATIAGAGLLGIEGYQIVAHSRPAMALFEKALASKDSQTAARFAVAAFNAAMRAEAEGPADAQQ